MPPSPRWLMLRAKGLSLRERPAWHERALLSLRRLRSRTLCGAPACDEEAIRDEMTSIREMLLSSSEVEAAERASAEGIEGIGMGGAKGGAGGGSADGASGEADCAEVLSARRALTAGLGLVLLQQVTGQPSVLYYQEAIFRDAGFGALAAYASVIVGGAKLVATLFTVSQIENYGRRPLLYVGVGMMLAALLALTAAFASKPPPAATGAAAASGSLTSVVIVVALMVYVRARPSHTAAKASPSPPSGVSVPGLYLVASHVRMFAWSCGRAGMRLSAGLRADCMANDL